MKKVKCYGIKKTNIVETSATKAFFEDYKPEKKNINATLHQNESSSVIECKELSCFDANQKSLFGSFTEESKKAKDCIKRNQKRKISTKIKPFSKIKKYKGKRKVQKDFKPYPQHLKSSIKIVEPRWDSIYKHRLAVEKHFKTIKNSADDSFGKDGDLIAISSEEEYNIASTNQLVVQSENSANQTVDLCSSLKNIDISSFNNSRNSNKLFSSSVSINPNSKFPFVQLKKYSFSKISSYLQNSVPITSTPLPKMLCSKNMNVSNLSAIGINQHKIKNTTISFESSSTSEVVGLKIPSRLSLKLEIKKLSSHFISNYVTQKSCAFQKSYSNIERTLFLSSDSCLKEGASDNNGQPSVLPKLLELCNQDKVLSFKDVYDWRKTVFRKIGEGSYGEVFTITENKKSVIIKVIPVSEKFENNLQSMDSVYSEIKVSLCLSELRSNKNFQTKNFNMLKGIRVVQGNYPDEMIKSWDEYNEVKTTYNYRPDIFDDQQIFAILELEYGGKDMSSFVFRNAVEAESVFKQIAVSLAIAEETHLFEHRDLHLGNILVQRNKSKKISYVFRGKTFSIISHGLLVNLIDFTLSRILDNGVIYYNDLADDKSLFNQSGDVQFEVYKATKHKLKNQWQECLLYSNVLWLNFLCLKFQEHSYSRPSSIAHKKSLQAIKNYEENLKLCKSATEFFEMCKIVCPFPDKILEQECKLSRETLFIDRKSVQKSNLFSKM